MKLAGYVVMVVAMIGGSAATGAAESCLDRAAEVVPVSTRVTVLRNDAPPVTGHLASVDAAEPSLTPLRTEELGTAPVVYPMSQIHAIKFQRTKVRPSLVVLGFAVGAFVGSRIAASSESDRTVDSTEDPYQAFSESLSIGMEEAISDAIVTVLGGLVGAGVGAIVSTAIPEDDTLECEGPQ